MGKHCLKDEAHYGGVPDVTNDPAATSQCGCLGSNEQSLVDEQGSLTRKIANIQGD